MNSRSKAVNYFEKKLVKQFKEEESMNGFMSAMKSTLNDEFNVSVTENGAVGYRTTGKELLDLNFAVASLRKASPNDIANRFVRAFF